MACLDFNEFTRFILAFDQAVEIDQMKDKKLRYNVWETTSEQVKGITSKLNVTDLPDANQSLRIVTKLKNALRRAKENSKKGGNTQADIFDSDFNKEMSIALHELMESVKGESDKVMDFVSKSKGIRGVMEVNHTLTPIKG